MTDTIQKILIVDDRSENLFALEKVLAETDAEAVRAMSGNEALTAILNHDFALAILDVQMPGMDGYELAELIRGESKTRHLPIIFLSAVYSDDYHVFRGYQAGAVDFIPKPYNARHLLSKVNVFLELDRQRTGLLRTIELEKSKSRLENILLSMADAVIVTSGDGVVESVNRGALSLLGRDDDEGVVGARVEDLIEDGDGGFSLPGEEAFHDRDARLVTAEGGRVPVRVSGSVILNGAGTASGAVLVARDVRELKLAEANLQKSLHELKRSNAELEQFAFVASHDLQEPLRMVSSYMQLLEKRYGDSLDLDAREFFGFAVEGAKRMKRLIDDLLELSRVDTRGRPFTAIDARSVANQVAGDLRLVIGETGARVTIGPLPTVMADETQLYMIFLHLLDNAIKFRGEESPSVDISSRIEGEEYVFSTRDNGLGIEPQYCERIFVIFQRLHPRDRYSGSGIGLALCRKIVERHNGRIWVESKPGEGSTFCFTLPVKQEKDGE